VPVPPDPAPLPRSRALTALDGWSFGLTAVAVLLAKAGWLSGLAW
jgi:hypothetical protein